MRNPARLAAALLPILVLGAGAVRAADPSPVTVVVESPGPDEVVRGRTELAPLAGVATAGDQPRRFDLILVVDVSGSTRYPSGIDIDGDGVLGVVDEPLVRGFGLAQSSDPEDSILSAEVGGAIALLDQLDPERVRVGVVTFSGEIDPVTGRRRSVDQVDALLEQPLTDDYALVRQALEAVVLRGPHGGTNMEAGVKLALTELAGLPGAQSTPRDAERVILLMTDGRPSLPFGQADVQDAADVEAVVAAARLAYEAGVRVNVFGLGEHATDYPEAVTEVARVSAGLYTPVRRPGDIVALLSGVSFANVESVVAVNLTTAEEAGANDFTLRPDGSFLGYVPVRPGRNRIRVSAFASDGSRGSTEVEIEFRHEDLTDAGLRAERDRVRERNRDLRLLMERERQQAARRKRERSVSIEVDEAAEDDEEDAP